MSIASVATTIGEKLLDKSAKRSIQSAELYTELARKLGGSYGAEKLAASQLNKVAPKMFGGFTSTVGGVALDLYSVVSTVEKGIETAKTGEWGKFLTEDAPGGASSAVSLGAGVAGMPHLAAGATAFGLGWAVGLEIGQIEIGDDDIHGHVAKMYESPVADVLEEYESLPDTGKWLKEAHWIGVNTAVQKEKRQQQQQ